MKPSNELLNKTIQTFSPYYKRRITVNEAEEIINNVCNLFDVLEESNEKGVLNEQCRSFKS